jgi:predicted transcriptional regulator
LIQTEKTPKDRPHNMTDAAERRTVSLHEVKVFLALRDKPGHWLTNDEIAKESGVKIRTARQYTLRLVKQGLLERAETFPAYKFRWATKGVEPNAYQQRIEAAIEPFGLA